MTRGPPKGTAKVPGSGRQPGTLNKATADVKALAREHGPAAIQELARLATEAISEQARVAAIKELLDRGYGRAPQAVTGEADGEPVVVKHIVEWLK